MRHQDYTSEAQTGQPGVKQADTTTTAMKDINHANIFKTVRTDLLTTQAPTLEHTDMVWPISSDLP